MQHQTPSKHLNSIFSAIVVMAMGWLSACSSQGCGGPIPGGFPPDDRQNHGVQIRVAESALETLSDDPSFLGDFALGGEFNLPADCSGNPEICCSGGQPQAVCGPIEIDLDEQEGDLPRIQLGLSASQNAIALTARLRVKTQNPIPISSFGVGCDLSVDSERGSVDDLTIEAQLVLAVDQMSNTTRINVVNPSVINLESSDISLGGNFLCSTLGDAILSALRGTIVSTLEDQLVGTINQQLCTTCESGNVADCGSFADSCVDGICMLGGECKQLFGMEERVESSSLFDGLEGQIDFYDVLGARANVDNTGVSMSLLTGARSVGGERCGPPASPLSQNAITPSTVFDQNTTPQGNTSFDIGIGLHKNFLEQMTWAFYENGTLCIDIDASTSDQLTTDAIAPLLMPSLTGLLKDGASPMTLSMRPQNAPSIELGGTDGAAEPHLTIVMDGLELDFSADIEDQSLVLMTMITDLRLPLTLDVLADGTINPSLDNVDDAFSNIEIKDSKALLESNDDLAMRVPALLAVALPSLLGNLGPIALPGIGNIRINVVDNGIVPVENNNVLAIFADLEVSDEPVPAGGCQSSSQSTPALFFIGILFLWFCLRTKSTSTLLFLLFIGLFQSGCGSCNDSKDKGLQCLEECLPGDVGERETGRFHDIAIHNDRVLVMAYEQNFGDLVVAEVQDNENLNWKTIDGVPESAPIYEPTTYRGGVLELGNDVGANPSLALNEEGLGRAAYQARDFQRVKFAYETSDGSWTSHTIAQTLGKQGHFISLSLNTEDVPVVAYNVSGVSASDGTVVSQLRIATAKSTIPMSSSDWSIETVDEIQTSCAGSCVCGGSQCFEEYECIENAIDERCLLVTYDCSDSCSESQACIEGACQNIVQPLPYRNIRRGTGLDISLQGDDADIVTFYNQATESWNVFARTQGTWASEAAIPGFGKHGTSALDDAGTLHMAFQNNKQRLHYASWSFSSGLSDVQMVDDGVRGNAFRPHPVGAGAAIAVNDSNPTIIYQDSKNAELWQANLNNGIWEKSSLLSGESLFGFRSSLKSGNRSLWFSTYMVDRSVSPSGKLLVRKSNSNERYS